MQHLEVSGAVQHIYIYMYIYIYIYVIRRLKVKQRCSKTHAVSCKGILRNILITNEMHFNVCYIFYSLYSQQQVSAAIAAIFRVMLLLQKYNCTNVVSCVDVTS